MSRPPSLMLIIRIPTRSLCLRSNSSIAIGLAPFFRSIMGSLHQCDKMVEMLRKFSFMTSTTPDTSLTTFMVFSMNSGMRSSLRHFRSVRPGDRATSILVIRSSSKGSSTGSNSVKTELYICTMWSSCATHCRYVTLSLSWSFSLAEALMPDLLNISCAAGGTSMSNTRKKRTSLMSLTRAGSKLTFSSPVFSCLLNKRIFNFSLAMSTEVFSQA
mmetsp:Transcript_54784/g.177210  ORF Transcript_54784/g.177210 Transcript_54784/m.177210 type:complete len:215 (-) Transcript_54784:469-1113(-)